MFADIRVIIDLVASYTGVDHPWFKNSVAASDPADPYLDYYTWEDCGTVGSAPPNNWVSQSIGIRQKRPVLRAQGGGSGMLGFSSDWSVMSVC